MNRRDLIIRGAPVAIAAGWVAKPAAAAPLPDLIGLDLAHWHGEQAAKVMADPTIWGRWELRIVTGNADQVLAFEQIGTGIAEARLHFNRARLAMQRATGRPYYLLGDAGENIIAVSGQRLPGMEELS